MKLIEFKADESALFEALSVIFFGADGPSPKQLHASIKAEDAFIQHGIETRESVFKMAACPYCNQRIGQYERVFKLPDGKGADMILEDRVFEYIHSRFEAWTMIRDAHLKRPFAELQERFAAIAANRDVDDIFKIRKYIENRDTVRITAGPNFMQL